MIATNVWSVSGFGRLSAGGRAERLRSGGLQSMVKISRDVGIMSRL
jgi:hypothetical protein